LPRYVLDACALIAFLNDEKGADKIEHLIEQSQAGAIKLYASSINIFEVYYDALRRTTSQKADELLVDLYEMPIIIVETVDRALIRAAGYFKTTYRISVADSIALGLAKHLNAYLVSTDHHEFDVIEASGDVLFSWPR